MAAAKRRRGAHQQTTHKASGGIPRQHRGRSRRRGAQASGRNGQSASFTHEAENFAERGREELRGFATPMTQSVEQVMRSWMSFFQRAAVNQTRLVQEMLELGMAQNAFAAQRSFIDDSLRNFADSTREVMRASGQVAAPAMRSAERAMGMGQAYQDHDQAQRRGGRQGAGPAHHRNGEEAGRRNWG